MDGIVNMTVSYVGDGDILVTSENDVETEPIATDENEATYEILVLEETELLVEYYPEGEIEPTESYYITINTANGDITNIDGEILVIPETEVEDGVLTADVPEELADEIDENTKSILIDATTEDDEVTDFIVNIPPEVLDALADILDVLDEDFELTILTNVGSINIPYSALADFVNGDGVIMFTVEENGEVDAAPDNSILVSVDLGAAVNDQVDPAIEISLFGITFNNPIPFWFHDGMFRRLGHNTEGGVFSFFTTHCSDFMIIDEADINEIKDSLDQSMSIDSLDKSDDRYLSGADNWVASGYEYYVDNNFTKLVQTDDVSEGEDAGKTYYNIGNVSAAEDVVIAPEGMEVTYYEFDGKIFDGAFVNENNIVAKESTASNPEE
jgi:hypothetical protein